MRGNVKWQVNQVFNEVRGFGSSKHDGKDDARAEGAKTAHEIAKYTDVYSYKTADDYRAVWRQVLNNTDEIKDITKLTNEHIDKILSEKIDAGLKFGSYQTNVAAIEKLELALNRYADHHNIDKTYDFSKAITENKIKAQSLDKRSYSRAYTNPREIIKNLTDPRHRVVARLQHEAGARVKEARHINKSQIQGNKISVQGKGGKIRDLHISNDLKKELSNAMKSGKLRVDYNRYEKALKAATLDAGQRFNGSHGLRHCFAQNRFSSLQKSGQSLLASLTQVSHEMGHARPDITEHYLR